MSEASPQRDHGRVWDSSFCRDDLVRFDLDGGMVVFDRRSGYTHLLDPVAAVVLSAISIGPLTPAALVETVEESIDCDEDIDLTACIEKSLLQLSALELARHDLP